MVHYTGNYWPHLNSGPPNGQLYSLTGKKYNLWPHFVIGPPSGPLYRLTGEKYNFWPYFDSILSFDHQMFPHTGEKCSFWPYFSSGPANGQFKF